MVKIRLAESLDLHNQKAPQPVPFNKWCGILCDYRTNNYEDFKELSRQIEVLCDVDVS